MNHTLRYSIFFILDSVMVLSAIFISHWLLNPSIKDNDTLIIISSIALLISHHIMAYFCRLYNRVWSVATVKELLLIGYSVTICVFATCIMQFFVKGEIYFRIMAITWLLHIVLIGGSRFLVRLFHDYRNKIPPQEELKKVLIVGAGEAGIILIRSIKRIQNSKLLIVGIVDDNPYKQNLTLMGIKVCGTTNEIPRIVQEKQVDEIILAIPSLGKIGIRKIYNLCANTNATIKTMPKIEDIMMGKVSVNDIQEVKIEQLLGRDEVKLDMEAISNKLLNNVILVTGAGGSIGSEICRQVIHFEPKKIILLGHGENSIYKIHMELLEKYTDRNIELIPIIADIQDRDRIFEVVEHFQPDVIYHAAAHKHVPLMEENAREAVKNNIFGTKNVAEAAHHYCVSNFVLISSDKAVNPTNVMGATKRIAEMVVQNLASYSDTNFTAVRFGNVLGSRGSVLPRFKAQIASGGPVTVTHPEMTRYFMTIPEASRLVIQAGVLAEGGEVFVLDMGEPIKIVDLAENLIRLSGFTKEEIQIEFSGIRPGEKMFEELLNEEEIQEQNVFPKIHVGKANTMDRDLLHLILKDLEMLEINEMKRRVINIANGKWVSSKIQPKTTA
ncbi:polysaccharide biosynthesis protein [Ureibacillus sp. GCM10028918]|uniref:polysaccharide biosynthesis protein n=1 Tax=Ureibacillus sp. GCM10028918 TaxID=3273429 RepID=UPI00361063D5